MGLWASTEEEYAKYYCRPNLPARMWTWTTKEHVKAIAGFSAVEKKDPSKLRKLLMACATNYMWVDVRPRRNLGMKGGTALAQQHVPSDAWSLAAFDESNAFTAVAVPEWVWAWQSAPPIMAWRVWAVLPLEFRLTITMWTWVYPLYMRLAMGNAHAVAILMAINVSRLPCGADTGGFLPPLCCLCTRWQRGG